MHAGVLRLPRLIRAAPDLGTDAELLRRFTATRDEPAFAELVRRHGPLVLAVCRRVVSDSHLADDAFQATFVVLARKAASAGVGCRLSTWLHSVAVKVSLRARTMVGRRAKRETLTAAVPEVADRSSGGTGLRAGVEAQDTAAVLDEEIDRLPESLRVAVVLCELRGVSRRDAAKELGIAEGTLSSRLATARKKLAERLRARGLAPAAGIIFAACVPTDLATAAVALSTGRVELSSQLTQLVDGGMKMALLTKLKLATVAVVVAMLSAGGFGVGPFANADAAPRTNAPVPKSAYPDGLIWVLNDITFEMVALTPDGTKAVEFKLKDGPRVLGITPDGKKLAFAGKNGKSADPKETDGLTVHLRDIGPELDGTDTGLKYEPGDWLLWSPDGRQVVRHRPHKTLEVLDGADPNYALYDLDTKKERNLVLDGGHRFFGWSPDGKWLLAASHERAAMQWSRWYKYTPADGKLHAITEAHSAYRMDVTADGKALIGYANSKVVKDPAARGAENWRAVRLDIESGEETVLDKFARPADYSYGWVRPAPRGERFLFWAGVERKGEGTQDMRLSVHDADGTEAKLVKRFDYNAWRELGWVPDPKADPRRKNAPIPKDGGDPGVVWSYNPQTGNLIACRPNGDTLKEWKLPYGNWFKGVTPDGTRFLYGADKRNVLPEPIFDPNPTLRLHTRPIDDEKAFTDLGTPVGYFNEIVWSPDAKQFFRVHFTLDQPRDLTVTVHDADGKERHKWTTTDKHPVGWTGDGTGLVLDAALDDGPKGKAKFVKSDLKGEKIEPLFAGVYFDSVRVSPDGTRLLGFDKFAPFLGEKPNKTVMVHDLTAKKTAAVVQRPDLVYADGVWSPDGKRIAYRWCEFQPKPLGGGALALNGQYHFATCDADGKNETELFVEPHQSAMMLVAWTPTPPALKNAKPQPRRNAPVPKVREGGRLWLHDQQANELVAYSPALTEVQRILLPKGERFRGLTPDGMNIVYADKPDGGTYHLRPLDGEGKAVDLGLDASAKDQPPYWNRSGTKFVRARILDVEGVQSTRLRFDVFDLATKKARHLEKDFDEHWMLGWADDEHLLSRVMSGNEYGTLCRTALDGKRTVILKDDKLHTHRVDVSGTGTVVVGAFQNTAPKQPWHHALLSMDAKTGAVTELFHDEEQGVTEPVWSPDGGRIAFAWWYATDPNASDGWDGVRLSVADADGKNRKTATLREKRRGQEPTTLSFLGWYPEPRRNAPVPKAAGWKEATPITFADGGRVTSVTYSPSGKTLAVARDSGKLDFYDPITRKHITTMNVGGEKGATVGTVTAVAFLPVSHPRNGDIFAVTHKHGVKFGTVGLGIFVDDAAKVEGIPPNIVAKDLDPVQVICLGNDQFVAGNGEESVWRIADIDRRLKTPGGKRGQPGLLSAIPGQTTFFLENGHTDREANAVYMAAEPPASSPQTRLVGHSSRPTVAAVSKDGKRIVSADAGGTLIVWEAKQNLDFKEKSRASVGPGLVQLALAPDGKTVAVLRVNGVSWLGALPNRSSEVFDLFVFDITDPPAKPTPIWSNETRDFPGKRNGPASLAFGPDGRTLLAAFADPFTEDKQKYGDIPKSVGVKVWTLAEPNEPKRNAPVPKGKPNALAYFPHEIGTRWVYEHVRPAAGEKPVKLLTIREVTGVVPDDGGVRVTIQQSYDSDPPMDKAKNVTHEIVYRITADGVDCLSFGGHKFTLPRRELLPHPAAGDEWPLFPTRAKGEGEPAAVRVGKEEAVTVPAGRYTALPLRWVGDGVPKTDKDQEYLEGMGIVPRTGSAQYYAKDVGLVKCDAYELREFTPGKPADPKKDGPKLDGKIAVWQGDSVAVLSPDGKELSRHTREELGEEFGSAFVRLSPDGRRVALAWCENHNRNSGHAAIFSADGKKVEHATGFIGAPWAAYWLADKDDPQFGINGSLKMHFLSLKSGEMMDAIGNGYNAVLAAAPNGVVVQQHDPKKKTLRVGTQEADDDDCYFVAEKDLGGTVVGVSRDGRTLLVVGAKGVILHDAKTGDRVTVADRADGCAAALASNGEAVVIATRHEAKKPADKPTFNLSVYDRATKETTVLVRDSKTPIRAVDFWSPAKADDRKKNAPVPKEKDAGLLWVKDEKDGRLTAYTPALEVAKRVKLPAAAKFIGLTPDGTGMVYANDSIDVRRAEQTQTYHIFPLGEDMLGIDLELDHVVWDFPPIWSPDGKKFLRVRKDVKRMMPGFLGTIFRYDVFDLATKKATHLADIPFDHWIMAWTADGKKFITQSLRKGEEDTLHLMDPDGTSKPLPAEEKALRPYKLARSPDGKTFLFSSYDSLWSIDAATGKRTELLDKTHGFPKPAWSPDGKRMAVAYCQFTKSKSPQPWDVQRLVVADADGTNRKEITLRDKANGEEAYDVDFLGWYPNPKPAPAGVAPPKKNAPVPKDEPKAVEAWGEAKGGLQAGLRMPRGATVSPDAAGEVQLVVRNVGNEAKEVTFWKRVGPAKAIEGRLDWEERGGKYDLRFYTILSGRPPEETTVRIKPGEEVVLWRTGVCNGPVVASPEGLDARHAFPPGMHKLMATATGAKAGADALTTGELEIRLPELKVTAPVPKEKEETMGLTASVTFDKKEILLGEPTYFTFQVQNPTDKGWQFEEGGDYRNRLGRPESFAVTVTGPDGKSVPQPDAGPSLGGIAVMVKLPADGKAAFRPLFLPHWATFEKPGEYTVTVKRQVGLVPGDAEDGFRAKATPVNLSATVKITVLPLDKKKMGELIETLGAAMLDHKTDGYDKAIKKMQAIRDERTVPFFIDLGKLPHPSDRFAACEGLSHYKTDEAFAALKKLYATTGLELRESATTQELANSSADGVRHAAIGAILQCGHPDALPFAWKTGIEDGYYGVRLTILHKAYAVKSPDARKVIAKLLDDVHESVRGEAKRYTDLLAKEK